MELIPKSAKLFLKKRRKKKSEASKRRRKKLNLFSKLISLSGDIKGGLELYFIPQYIFFRKKALEYDLDIESVVLIVVFAEMISFTYEDIQKICGGSLSKAKYILKKLLRKGFIEKVRISGSNNSGHGSKVVFYPTSLAKGVHNMWVVQCYNPVEVVLQ